MPNFNIISFYGIFPRGKNSPNLYLVALSLSLLFPLSLSPTILPSFHSSSLSPPLPTRTQDNHPKARFSIKSVTHSRSHRAIRGIMHTKHSNAKLFFDSPVRKITARTHTCTYGRRTMSKSAQRQTNHAMHRFLFLDFKMHT